MKVQDFRNHVYRKALNAGESLMPQDVADLMTTANRSGKFKHLLFQLSNIRERFEMLVDIYESCGFVFPDREFSVDRYQDFF
jgi:hypothetical protein